MIKANMERKDNLEKAELSIQAKKALEKKLKKERDEFEFNDD